MLKMWTRYFKTFVENKKGQGMVEYGLIISLVAVGVIIALTALGGQLSSLFNALVGKLTLPA